MKYDATKIKIALRKAFTETGMDPKKIDDAIFHMTDWLEDHGNLNSFYEDPDSKSAKEISDLLMKFLVHVPAHVAAASKLVTELPVSDVFGIGATSEEEN